MPKLSRLADKVLSAILLVKTAILLTLGVLLLVTAICLALPLDERWLLQAFAALVGCWGISLVSVALQPFAGRTSNPQDRQSTAPLSREQAARPPRYRRAP
jgi:O-antigen/teichoic acid export membrane protein